MKKDLALKKLSVFYHDRLVGLLAYLPDGRLGFQYDEGWLKDGFSISPFSLPLQADPFFAKKDTFDGLFGVFDDSLPEGWGTLLMIRKLREEGIDYGKLNPLAKLSLLSTAGKGALRYRPNFSTDQVTGLSELDHLSEECSAFLKGEKAEDLDRLVGLGGSSGGARPKVQFKDTSGEWIVKFPNQEDGPLAGKQEFETNLLAQKAGLKVNEFRLFPSQRTPGYFGAKRFDRLSGSPVHMVSLAGLLEVAYQTPVLDYIHLLQVIQKLCKSPSDLLEGYRRMVFNVRIENKDDHGKNFSFLYDENEKRYRLSPAYDLTRTPFLYGHELSVNGKDNPTDEDLYAVADYLRIRHEKAKAIIEEVTKAVKG